MHGKIAREKALGAIIVSEKLANQEELTARLREKGFSVTQATLSRDLKALGVGKIPDNKGGYYYAVPGEQLSASQSEQYRKDFHRGFLSVEFSRNLGVVRTIGGHAPAVALALDSMEFSEILGTVAGDDTVLVVIKEDFKPKDFLKNLYGKMGGKEP
jgi:transcriptional regulator of arginine metabolism